MRSSPSAPLSPRRLALRRVVAWCGAGVLAWLAGCASLAPSALPADLFDDRVGEGSLVDPDVGTVFALSEPMRRYAAERLRPLLTQPDPRRALVGALYDTRQLRLDYDSSQTRTAAQAFDARAGNCLSLVVMTAAFAKHLGLSVGYQAVLADEVYARAGSLTLAVGHVNLVLGRVTPRGLGPLREEQEDLTVDFVPQASLRGQRTEPLEERTVLAMFMNNRAAEALAERRVADAHVWARAALQQDGRFLPALNTLGVVYRHAGQPQRAERVWRLVLARDDSQTSALANLVGLLQHEGRVAEAAPLLERLRWLQPYPPFHFYELGRMAMSEGRYAAARAHFARELRRQPELAEVHFWAALAELRLGATQDAEQHLRAAINHSTTLDQRQLYAAKLDRLQAPRGHDATPR